MTQFDKFDKGALRGQWPSVLMQLGVPKQYLTKKNCPCPFCQGTDRFRFTDKGGDGLWICNHCGSGDGVGLAMRYLGITFQELKDKLREIKLGPPREIKEVSKDDLLKERAALWNRGSPVSVGDPVDRYLTTRLGRIIRSNELRTLLTDDGAIMLARYAVGRRMESIHRTFLTKDGEKVQRKMMHGDTAKGGAIRLVPAAHTLGLAEGVETALAAWVLFNIPTWATVSEQFLRVCEIPEHVKQVVIFGDNDLTYTGHAAAYACANRLARQGKAVEVRIPDTLGFDWNDVLLSTYPHNAGKEAINSRTAA